MASTILERFKEYVRTDQFNALRIGLASPEKIRALSYGEVKKMETINYRTLKPERDGLFCPRIFGPVKDWECTCGKYKRMKHRGITCEKCGVEVIESRVRRERMGHINLVAPVCHIWYLKGIPSYLSLVLDMSVKDLERIIYFDMYAVVKQGASPYPPKTLLSTSEVEKYQDLHPDDAEFTVQIGAEAIRSLLHNIDLRLEIEALQKEHSKTTSVAARHKLMRRTKVLSGFLHGDLRPEWMVFDVLPVLPPDLRPLVPLEGGRFASSDLNELYRRVINRNIRLQRLEEIQAPSVIIKNERRMLQESVDALVDNGRRGQPVRGTSKRPLKSLSEMLRGKQGRFRQNLLGKRVDYSGRSVIVVDPELRIDQCGVPKKMALELFKSHVYAELLEREVAPNLRAAKRMVDEEDPEIWSALEHVVQGHPVLLNRAPTLHKLGIQSFYPILVDGKAIKIHPLVCSAYNADFDGDQMAVHVPLSMRARREAENLMLSSRNVLSNANGKPVMEPSLEMVLGLHYITRVRKNVAGEGLVFSSVREVLVAYQTQAVALHAPIKVRVNGEIVETGVGRVLLYDALPEGADIAWVNQVMNKGELRKLVENVCYTFGDEATVAALDRLKRLGFSYATYGGISFPVEDLVIPQDKYERVKKSEERVAHIEELYMDGSISNSERYNRIINTWGTTTANVAQSIRETFKKQDQAAYENADGSCPDYNAVHLMLRSGARSSMEQVKQLVGMRGLMAKPSGEIMETPVKSNFREGLSVFEYFISTHGARKGQADTALKTANSGYLTRRLIDVAQDVVVSMQDCGAHNAVTMEDMEQAGEVLSPLHDRIVGRFVAEDVRHPADESVMIPQGTPVSREQARRIAEVGVTSVRVRSVLTCQASRGVCATCYGINLARNGPTDVGETVGIVAAQSIGEPGTQLTMRTFHIGGTASLSEQSSFAAKHSGTIQLTNVRSVVDQEGRRRIVNRKARLAIVNEAGRRLQRHALEYGSILHVEDGEQVTAGTKLCEWDSSNRPILSERTGYVSYVDLVPNVTMQEQYDEATNRSARVVLRHKSEKYEPAIVVSDKQGEELGRYYLPTGSYISVDEGQHVHAGDVLVKLSRQTSRTQDITGGLPRISELFEARMPKDPATLADIDGEVVFSGTHRGMRKISVVGPNDTFEYFIPRGKQLMVSNGEHVNAGDTLTGGEPVLHDILRIKGVSELHMYLVDQIQSIYRSQGIDINDRHIELIVRQMLRKVRIVRPGDTDFLVGDKVDRSSIHAINDVLRDEGKSPAQFEPILMGITLASLGTESFISAASFQETTRILSEAAISGQVDYLYGLKENVILGKLIPAGTGVDSFREKYIGKSVDQSTV